MKLHFKSLIKNVLAASILVCGFRVANAQTVTFSSANLTDAYMSWAPTAYTVANYPGDGGSGAGTWSLAALPAVFSTNILTIGPNVNTYAAGNTYWVNPNGTGANQMDGAVYNETAGTYVSATVTFTFNVLSNTLASGYSADAFIKDFGPGYAYNGEQTVNLTPGVDSVTYPLTGASSGEIVQFGFEVIGPNANPATVASLGSVVIAPVQLSISPSALTSLAVVAGQNASFTETPTGDGPFKYQWQLNGQNLANANEFSGVTSNVLTITGATAADAGTYTVNVTNAVGSNTLANGSLVIVPLSQAQTNYVIDPSFESAAFAPVSAVGWLSYGGTAFANTNDWYSQFDPTANPDVSVINGTNCLIEYSGGPNSYTGVFQDRPALPGQIYTASAWFFTPDANLGYPLVNSAGASLQVQFYNSSGGLIWDYVSSSFTTNNQEDKWVQLQVTNKYANDFVTLLGTGPLIVSPPGTASMRIQPGYHAPDA
ncbi:MAG TPA: immunoglobulin domain-containing protein, partial [Verrucomicrobiae bacterium]|nr:immunoglobulin domain-containing protein [Verrucomicrobiae bacterium]